MDYRNTKSVSDGGESSTQSPSADETAIRHDSVAVTREPTPKLKAQDLPRNNSFLSAPLSGPIRPLSPDTLSNLSIDEYETIRPGRRRSSAGSARTASTSPAPPVKGFKGWLQRFWVRNKGLGYMLLGQIFGTLMNVTTRLLEVEGQKGKGLHPFNILFARMGITFFLASGYMWWKSTPHFPFGQRDVRWLLAVRGLAGFFGVFGMYYSLLYLPLSDATVITFLAPGLACWACSILINEPFTRIEMVGGLVSLVGVVFIAKPASLFATGADSESNTPSTSSGANPETGVSDAGDYASVTPTQRLTAVGVALTGVLGSATVYTVIRWIGKRAHPLITVNYFAAWCFLVSIVAQSVLPDVGFLLPADLKEWGYLIFLGVCGFIMQFLLAAGLAYEKSGRATNIAYTQMLFALGFDKLFFGHTPGIMSIIGSSLILGSAIVIAMQKTPGQNQHVKEVSGDNSTDGDEESRVGLVSDVVQSEDHERMPVQEVQLRTLR